MFDDPVLCGVGAITLLAGVVVLFWWQDFDGVRSAWEYRRRTRKRERLTGAEFYRRFYRDRGIPAELVIAVRDFHASYWGEDPELLRPEDDLFGVNAGADCAGWAAEVEARFGVVLPECLPPELQTALPRLDQTFDTVLRCVYALRVRQRPPSTPP